MKTDSSRVIIHMVSSLDGYVAKKDNSVDWLHSTDSYDKGETLTEEYIEAFLKTIDCYVMGSRTYEHALELGWPYEDVPVIVLTHRDLKTDRQSVNFYSGDLEVLVNDQLKTQYQSIWMVGGSQLAREFIRLKLADDIIMSIMPVLLGAGTLFFDDVGKEQPLHLKDVKAYKDGMVELSYEIIKQ